MAGAVSDRAGSEEGDSTVSESSQANPLAAFGPNEWLVDELYQKYLEDPQSVDRAWWDFFADYAGAQQPEAGA